MENIESWNELLKKISIGDVVEGNVIKVERYGIFVDIGEAFNGLILIPHLSKKKYLMEDDYPKVGQYIKGIVLDFSRNDTHIEHSYISLNSEDYYEKESN